MLNSTNKFIKELQKDLTPDNVLSAIEERYAYAQDASNSVNISQIPDAVVFVRNTQDVINVIKKAGKFIPSLCSSYSQSVLILIDYQYMHQQ